MDHIDLYYQHRVDPAVPEEEVAGLMADFIREGKSPQMGNLVKLTKKNLRKASCDLPGYRCSEPLFHDGAVEREKLFPVLEELNIGFVAFSPLANGFLTDAYNNRTFTEPTDYRSIMPQFTPKGYKEK